jgi:hypothetical protein
MTIMGHLDAVLDSTTWTVPHIKAALDTAAVTNQASALLKVAGRGCYSSLESGR